MVFAASDEAVEAQLGPLAGTWKPVSQTEIARVALVSENNAAISWLSLFGLFAGAAAAAGTAYLTRNKWASIAAGIGVISGSFYGVIQLARTVHQRRRLDVFERGIRFGRDIIGFDELKLIRFGAPKTMGERHFPTLGKLQRKVDKLPEITQKRDNGRKLAITVILSDDNHIVWPGFLVSFSKEDLTEFFELLKSRHPEKLYGWDLRPDDLQRITDL